MLWPNPETFAMATVQLNTNCIAELKTKSEFTESRGWLSCRVNLTAATFQLEKRSLFLVHDLLPQSGRLYMEAEFGEQLKTCPCVLPTDDADMMFIKTNTFVCPWKSFKNGLIRAEAVRCDALSVISGFYLDGIWKMLPRPCLVCFHFSWGGKRRSPFVLNCWVTSANEEVSSFLTGLNTAERSSYETLKQGNEQGRLFVSTFQFLSSAVNLHFFFALLTQVRARVLQKKKNLQKKRGWINESLLFWRGNSEHEDVKYSKKRLNERSLTGKNDGNWGTC